MAKAKGKVKIVILLALSAALTNSFTYHDSQLRRCVELRPAPSSHYRAVASQPAAPASSTALVFSENNMASAGHGTDREFVEGYEYVHPDIAAMLLAEATTKESDDASPFMVDTTTLTLERGIQRQDDVVIFTDDVMPIDLLAGLADECDRAVFTGTTQDDAPKKISGLICLSQLSSTSWPSENAEEIPVEMQKSATLIASMVALNLLESSIRSIVLTTRRGKNKVKDSNKTNHNANSDYKTKSTGGSPLLSLLIEQMSKLDHISLGRAPSTYSHRMVLSASHLAPILRALLLPTKMGGINLRNLVSHGFLSTIERRWFSLTLVLIQTLDRMLLSNQKNENDKEVSDGIVEMKKGAGQDHGTSSFTKYRSMARVVHDGKEIMKSSSTVRELELRSHRFVPSPHIPLLRSGLQLILHSSDKRDDTTKNATQEDKKNNESTTKLSIPSLPAVFTTVMCSILEHSLRIVWCEVNNRPNDCFARPSEYYVTLDGHGQRLKHEVMVSPYLGDETTRNQIIHAIGAESFAMLSDLFAAPSTEAPNIRSAVCHGSWDHELVKEMEGLSASHGKNIDGSHQSGQLVVQSDPFLVDAACAMLSCLDLISSNLSKKRRISRYRPVYSYTAMATRSLDGILHVLTELDEWASNNLTIGNCIKTMEIQQPKLCGDLSPFKIDLEVINEMAYDLFPTMATTDDDIWSVELCFSEHQTNLALSDNIVLLTLLADASNAIKKYLTGVQERIGILSMQPSSTKDRRLLKTATRFCSVAMIARDFYTFTVYVALVAMKHHRLIESPHHTPDTKISRDDIVKASERSRMAISTFDSHVSINLDRSLKALQQYLQGKAVKKILLAK